MPDPMAPAIAYYYCDSDIKLHELCAFLILKRGEWFDVRRATKHRWAVCFNAIANPPKDIMKALIPIEAQPSEIERNVQAYKAKKAAEERGKKTKQPKGR